jgi:hypothetical protein
MCILHESEGPPFRDLEFASDSWGMCDICELPVFGLNGFGFKGHQLHFVCVVKYWYKI